MKRWSCAALAGTLLMSGLAGAEDARPTVVHPDERGSVLFKPLGDQQQTPDRYRLELRTFLTR